MPRLLTVHNMLVYIGSYQEFQIVKKIIETVLLLKLIVVEKDVGNFLSPNIRIVFVSISKFMSIFSKQEIRVSTS